MAVINAIKKNDYGKSRTPIYHYNETNNRFENDNKTNSKKRFTAIYNLNGSIPSDSLEDFFDVDRVLNSGDFYLYIIENGEWCLTNKEKIRKYFNMNSLSN